MRKLLTLTVCFMLIGVTSSFAKPESSSEHVWSFGPEMYYVGYREPGVMRETGIMYGLQGSYAYHNNVMLKVEGRGSIGEVDYENSGTLNNVPDHTFEFRELLGYDFPALEKSTFTPYFGFGYRYLNDDSAGKKTSDGSSGYGRTNHRIYSPIGLEWTMRMENEWSIGATAEYDLFWWGRQMSYLSDANPSYGDVKNTQKKGYGLRGSVKLQKNTEKIDYIIEPFVRYWNIAQSNNSNVTYAGVIVGTGYEPKNNTTELGVNFGVRF